MWFPLFVWLTVSCAAVRGAPRCRGGQYLDEATQICTKCTDKCNLNDPLLNIKAYPTCIANKVCEHKYNELYGSKCNDGEFYEFNLGMCESCSKFCGNEPSYEEAVCNVICAEKTTTVLTAVTLSVKKGDVPKESVDMEKFSYTHLAFIALAAIPVILVIIVVVLWKRKKSKLPSNREQQKKYVVLMSKDEPPDELSPTSDNMENEINQNSGNLANENNSSEMQSGRAGSAYATADSSNSGTNKNAHTDSALGASVSSDASYANEKRGSIGKSRPYPVESSKVKDPMFPGNASQQSDRFQSYMRDDRRRKSAVLDIPADNNEGAIGQPSELNLNEPSKLHTKQSRRNAPQESTKGSMKGSEEKPMSTSQVDILRTLPTDISMIPDIVTKFKKLKQNDWVKGLLSNGRFIRIAYDAIDELNAKRIVVEQTGLDERHFACVYEP